jgi:hypothetical protein
VKSLEARQARAPGAEVAGAGQDRRGGPDELDGGVVAVRAGLEAGERWSGHFGQVSCTPTSNPECGEGWSGAPRPARAPVRVVGRLGPKYRHGAGLNRSNAERMRRTNAQRLWRALICCRGNKTAARKVRGWLLTSGRCSGRLGAAFGAPGGRHSGRGSPASSGGGG